MALLQGRLTKLISYLSGFFSITISFLNKEILFKYFLLHWLILFFIFFVYKITWNYFLSFSQRNFWFIPLFTIDFFAFEFIFSFLRLLYYNYVFSLFVFLSIFSFLRSLSSRLSSWLSLSSFVPAPSRRSPQSLRRPSVPASGNSDETIR